MWEKFIDDWASTRNKESGSEKKDPKQESQVNK